MLAAPCPLYVDDAEVAAAALDGAATLAVELDALACAEDAAPSDAQTGFSGLHARMGRRRPAPRKTRGARWVSGMPARLGRRTVGVKAPATLYRLKPTMVRAQMGP